VRVLVTCWPFVGHVFGQLGAAEELRARGHDVRFYTGEQARARIEGAGFTVFGFERVDEAAVASRVETLEIPPQSGRPNPRLMREAFREWLAETIPDQMADLTKIFETWTPDVIVTDLSMWAPIVILSETTSIPVALSSTFMGPLLPGPDAPVWGFGFKPPHGRIGHLLARLGHALSDLIGIGMRRRVDALRADYGLGPMGCSVNEYSGRLPLYLVGNLPELDYNRTDLPVSVHYTGHNMWHPPTDPTVNAWLDTVPTGRPWVHVTESTLRAGDPFLLKAAIAGFADAEVEVIATTGGHRDPDSLGLGPLPANIHLTSWVNHDELLPRCSAVVTTGGQATIMSALAVGVPLVIVPTTWDKPDNARRVMEAGVGVRVNPRKSTPENIRAAVDEVLTDPRYRTNAKVVAGNLAAAPGRHLAADLIEALTGTRSGSHAPATAEGSG
jgi:UDP:flavonoid glycosyltransferase YjiC (YdhE family)